MQAYRELLSGHKKSQLAHDIRLLAEQQGQYIRLFSRGQHQYEAVLSREPGYLLGETIWHFFSEPENLIYCEALPDSAHVLLVVVRASSVYMDAKLLATNLQSELLPLMTDDISYRIITVGNVPLRKAESFGTFRFPSDLIERFETLKEPIFMNLPALKSLQVQPLPLALKAEHLTGGLPVPVIALFVLGIMVGAGWLLIPRSEPMVVQRPVLKKTMNPYSAYLHALNTPSPADQLNELAHQINTLYFLPGWQVTRVRVREKNYCFALESNVGELQRLHRWAEAHHYQFNLETNGVTLCTRSRLSSRAVPTEIYRLSEVVDRVMDDLQSLLGQDAVHFVSRQARGELQVTTLSVRIDNVSPDLLTVLSQTLQSLPIEMNTITLEEHAGLLSGTFQLVLWGK